MKETSLICKNYQIYRSSELTTLQVEFVLPIRVYDSKKIAEALKNIELLLGSSEGIDLVKGADRPRCQWCGVLHDEGVNICPQCGGEL